MTGREINLGLLWHSASSGNLGVGALTVANMAIVRGVAAEMGLVPRFTIIGMRDGVETYVDPAEAPQVIVDRRAMLDPKGIWATIRRQDLILDIGGGDSFTDIYSSVRYAFIWAAKAMAIAARRPLALCPQTIGPFSRQPHTALAAWALRHSAVVVARDRASLDATRALAPKVRTVLACDVAIAQPFEDRSAERGGKRPRVGVNVSGLLFNEAVQGSNRFGLQANYAELTRSFLRELERRGAEIHLVTHAIDPRPDDDDSRVANLLAAEFPSAIRVPNFPDPSAAKSYISSLDFLVSGRMHACIAAVSSGTPVVPIAYSRKFSGVFGLVEYPTLIDVKGMSDAEALAFLLDALDRRAELAEACAASVRRVETYLESYRQVLRELFGTLRR
jgi:colanic acid/amylovoran biosynthesis protein